MMRCTHFKCIVQGVDQCAYLHNHCLTWGRERFHFAYTFCHGPWKSSLQPPAPERLLPVTIRLLLPLQNFP